MARPFKIFRPLTPLFIGALLPDLIDKPLRYLWPGQFHGTRLFAHTLAFLIVWILIAAIRKSAALATVAFGIFTHLFVDNLGDALFVPFSFDWNQRILFWPLAGFSFPKHPYLTLEAQMQRVLSPYFLWTEIGGLCILILFYLVDCGARRKEAI